MCPCGRYEIAPGYEGCWDCLTTESMVRAVDLSAIDTHKEIPPPSDPMGVATAFVKAHYSDRQTMLLRHHRGRLVAYDGRAWPEVEDRGVVAAIYMWLEEACFRDKSGALQRFQPNRRKVADVVEALKAVTHLDAPITPPAWLSLGPNKHTGVEFVAMQNGLLHLPTRKLLLPDPNFFNDHALAFDFDPNAPEPVRWFAFLRDLWGDDQDAIDTLAEIIGYLLVGGTRQQKIFLLNGPKRSGKGTIGRVITRLLGPYNVAAPTLAGLATNFGLSPLIGRPLALISDARLSARHDAQVAVERLLSISGEDFLTIDRKYREPWTGRLGTRFLILTNELPRFTDQSGALASRFVVLTLQNSFYGRENPLLTEELLEEAPGIYNWALAGLDRMNERGHFQMPPAAAEALVQLEDLSSPVGAFVRDCCRLDPSCEISKDELYAAWVTWCEGQGHARVSTKPVFFRDLRAAIPTVRYARPRDGDHRSQVVEGVELGQHPSRPLTGQRWSGIGTGQSPRSKSLVRDGQRSSAVFVEPAPESRAEASERAFVADAEAEALALVKSELFALERSSIEHVHRRRAEGTDRFTVARELVDLSLPPPAGFEGWTASVVLYVEETYPWP